MSDTLRIITNNVPRPILYSVNLSQKELLEFDWIENNGNCIDDYSFFRYKGNVYCLEDIMRVEENSPLPKVWQGYVSELYFAGIVIRYTSDNEQVIVGTYTEGE